MGKYQKGQEKPPGSGRTPGAPNKATAKLRDFLDRFLEARASDTELIKLYDELGAKEKAVFLPKIIAFRAPILKQLEIQPSEMTPELAREILNSLLVERNQKNERDGFE